MLHVTNWTTCDVSLVSKEAWVEIVTSMKEQCCFVAARLIIDLEKQFLAQELLNAIKVIYLQYWLALEAETIFLGHMALF
jgi:hypothetical protein